MKLPQSLGFAPQRLASDDYLEGPMWNISGPLLLSTLSICLRQYIFHHMTVYISEPEAAALMLVS